MKVFPLLLYAVIISVSTQAYALPIIDVRPGDFVFGEENYLNDTSSADSEISHGPIAGGGYSIAVSGMASAYANVSTIEFWDYGDDAKGTTIMSWFGILRLIGEAGEAANINVSWDFLMTPVLEAVPAAPLVPSGSRAVAITDARFNVGETETDIHADAEAYWFEFEGTPIQQSGSFSLGPMSVGSIFGTLGNFRADGWADMNPHGRAAAWQLSSLNIKITPEPIATTVPEPSTLLLAIIGFAGLAMSRIASQRRNRAAPGLGQTDKLCFLGNTER